MTIHFSDGTLLTLTNDGLFAAVVVGLAALLLVGILAGVSADVIKYRSKGHDR